ncbi:UDP-glycosyltransferase UGT5-like [Wyeomyia smithii]|uniref:UDP-glycosyltransferase UGT5-like n=1 Tax=Wyeomyia smithii TaxID=174621 RepID=UPI002467ADE5|nr:UDP-glycosyltransferase UGT5-like [Wyeomyia smithii]XP_055549765.1 UDP-glycosyltransferase UGT5-like [Wyeomyia smithii]XP_055549766.1 UDP-glycosyltransferase UGT5-like [Wyeomyia smithii]XP_055549767.1 UDP-glycosyltransferase UGT5-like [Wyeomyia smithii]XP_055549768.1 UDP-glycosyltransferase UGT5-like [Wyeomyia smithii]XP_055549769.1 UDP-glycosyltransferase UGT5-like [Wyeomyia smithii]XP_055549771.1 UDP-glycosyltransferase UGT5-like [Wyeomyia smithii]XP_055549772.1 UDP-glycosyltransferase 
MAANSLSKAIFILAVTIASIDSAKILAIFPVPFKEHQLMYRPLIEHLADKGHDITLLTTDAIDLRKAGKGSLIQRIQQIDLGFVYDLPILEDLNKGNLDARDMLRNVFNVMRKISEAELRHPLVQELILGTAHFDVVMVEWSGVSLMNAFAYHFSAPLVGVTNGGAYINAHEALGNPNHPIGYPSIFMPFTEDLSLLQRISSVFFTIWYRFYYYAEEIPKQNLIANAIFGSEVPDLFEIERQADLLLINCYQALGNVRPVGPTTIYLGGIHQSRNMIDGTSFDLNQFLEHSHEPIVYVNLDPAADQWRLDKIIKALEKLDATVVCNWNSGQFINTTARIYQSYNLQQEEILAHPKVKLFITSGGQRNIEDAIHHRVPVLGISYSSSLEHYLRQVAKYEIGIISLIDFETQTSITEKLQDAFLLDVYQSNVDELNRMLADQPMTSLDRAAWWIEYVVRHGGTRHLRAPQLSWFQYLMLDVTLAVAVLATLAGLAICYLVTRAIRYSKSLPFEMVTRGSKKCKLM